MRRVPALLVTAGLVALALTGCSSSGNTACGIPSGNTASSVTVSKNFGAEPKVSFPKPLIAKKLERATVIQGKGATIPTGKTVAATFALYSGAGDYGGSTGFAKADEVLLTAGTSIGSYPGVAKAVQCSAAGSRIVVTGTLSQLLGASNASQSGASPATPALAVIDVRRTFAGSAQGEPRPSQPGFPTVVLAPNGQPGIKLPASTKAPTKVAAAVLKQGGGATLKSGDIVVAKYTAVQWSDNTVLNSSWSNGNPVMLSLGPTKNAGATALPATLQKVLVGKKVGSQVVVNLPEVKGSSSTTPASAWVIDILGVA